MALGLQQRLNQLGAALAEDGIVGSKTVSAVRAFQARNALAVDGIVGPKTWAKLDEIGRRLLAARGVVKSEPNVVVGQSPDAIPPPGKPYDVLPLELRETLARSFRDRKNNLAAALPVVDARGALKHSGNLENGFLFSTANPATLWDALDNMELVDLCTLRQVFDRWTAAGLPWDLVLYIRNVWVGTSRGMKFKSRDNALLTGALDAVPRMCREDPIVHIFTESLHPRQQTWREAVRGPGIHVCVGPDTREVPNDVHIDWHSPASSRTSLFKTCAYDLAEVLVHQADLRNERFPSAYERLPAAFRAARSGLALARARVTAQRGVVDAVEATVNELERRARDRRRACRGAAGEREVEMLLEALPLAVRPLASLR